MNQQPKGAHSRYTLHQHEASNLVKCKVLHGPSVLVTYPSSKKESFNAPPHFLMIWIASMFILPCAHRPPHASETPRQNRPPAFNLKRMTTVTPRWIECHVENQPQKTTNNHNMPGPRPHDTDLRLWEHGHPSHNARPRQRSRPQERGTIPHQPQATNGLTPHIRFILDDAKERQDHTQEPHFWYRKRAQILHGSRRRLGLHNRLAYLQSQNSVHGKICKVDFIL
jgi:hypothetical protein